MKKINLSLFIIILIMSSIILASIVYADTTGISNTECTTYIDCLEYNIRPIQTCYYIPDGNEFTLDERDSYISLCEHNKCTIPTDEQYKINHACSVVNCGAPCALNNDCPLCEYECSDNPTTDPSQTGPTHTVTVEGTCLSSCSCGECAEPQDKDGDLYSDICGDCDDNDNLIYPSAEEVCDGKDNNCDGNIDEGYTADADNDGILDCVDTIKGDSSDMTIHGLDGETKFLVNGVEVDTATGKQDVEIKNINNGEERVLVSFSHDFDIPSLDLTKIIITVEKGFISIEGLELTDGETKTASLEATDEWNSVCIKDAKEVSQISAKCLDENEYPLDCPSLNGGYKCEVIEIENTQINITPSDDKTYFIISGLEHSAVGQQDTCGNSIKGSAEECDGTDFNEETCTTKGFDRGSLSCDASCNIDTSSCSTFARSGGTNNNPNTESECESEWECSEWGADCSALNRLIRNCYDIKKCNNNDNKPATTQYCEYEANSETANENVLELEEAISGETITNQLAENNNAAGNTEEDNSENLITGAAVEDVENQNTPTSKSKSPLTIIIIIVVIVILLLGFYFFVYKKGLLKKKK